MNLQNRFKITGQLILAMALILGFHSTAYGKNKARAKFKPTYKVERCDCVGFSEDIPTFLTTLAKTDDLDELYIYGEGKTLKAAEKQAEKMCIQTYRDFASVSKKEHPNSVTQSGCTKLKSTPDGEWVNI